MSAQTSGANADSVATPRLPIAPGKTLGVIGGGQLGRMFVHAAQRMGYFTAVLDPDADSPAGRVSHHHVPTGYLDEGGLARLADLSDAITTEFENVPAAALTALALRRPVAPGAAAVAIAQDRALEKTHFARCGVACAPYALITSAQDLAAVPPALLPGILKTTRLGYDGKGQQIVGTLAELAQAWQALGQVSCVLERKLALALECSVVVARGADRQMVHLPVQRNLHRGGILAMTEVHPQNLPLPLAQRAVAAARDIAAGIDYVGVLCVEFFVLQDGALVVNEMAPRPHNSGHWSMDGCDVSQFELQVRALAGLPLPTPRPHGPTVMLNLMGELWLRGDHVATPPWAELLALPGTHLHLYGKNEPRPGRKMGHLNLTGDSLASVRATALRACVLLGIAPFAWSDAA